MPLPRIAKKMSRTLARDEAYEKLRGWIIAGRLCPGETLRDQDIATALGVSRTPVREALRRLEDEGLVETALNRWTRVASLDLEEAAETYAVVEALELLALELAFAHLRLRIWFGSMISIARCGRPPDDATQAPQWLPMKASTKRGLTPPAMGPSWQYLSSSKPNCVVSSLRTSTPPRTHRNLSGNIRRSSGP